MATQKTKTQTKTTEAAKEIEAAANGTKETVETMMKAGTDNAAQNMEKAVKMGQEQFDKANAKAFEAIDELYAFNKQNIDAFVTAGSLYLKGMEAINKEIVAYTQQSVEASLANVKAVLTAKSLQEVVDLHNGFTKQAFDGAVAESTKLSELSTQVANEASRPISDRVKLTVEKFAKTAA